jgi:hypothetical protein
MKSGHTYHFALPRVRAQTFSRPSQTRANDLQRSSPYGAVQLRNEVRLNELPTSLASIAPIRPAISSLRRPDGTLGERVPCMKLGKEAVAQSRNAWDMSLLEICSMGSA